MKRFLPVIVVILLGLVAGWSTALVQLQSTPWDGSPEGAGKDPRIPDAADPEKQPPKLVVDEVEHNFGTMNMDAEETHDFIFANKGQGVLELSAGDTSCRCTVSRIEREEVPPGQSTKVTLEWRSQGQLGPYRHTATIYSNDPARQRVTLAISGRVTVAVRVVPSELVFRGTPADEPAVGEAVVYGYLDEPLEILGFELAYPKIAEHFDVAFPFPPLPPDQVAEEPEARNGYLLKVTVKPGLPLGTFRQRIQIRTNLAAAQEVGVPIVGTVVGDISVAGPGWNDRLSLLTIGTVSSEKGAERRLMLIVRGPYRKEVKFEPVEVFPDLLQVTVGQSTESKSGAVTLVPLIIQIPKGSPPANHLGSKQGKAGRFLIRTNHPKVPQLQVFVRFAVKG